MDTKVEIKEEESLSDDVAPQNETEFFCKAVAMKRNSDAVYLDNQCDIQIKTDIKSETHFINHVKQIKSEGVMCSDNWEIDRKTETDEQTLISEFGSQSKGEPLPELGKFKIEIKEEPLWLETETSAMCDDIKDKDLPPIKSSRLQTEGVSIAVTGISPLLSTEVSGVHSSLYPKKDNPEFKYQKSDVTEMATAEKHVISEHSGKCSEGEEMYIRPLHLKQKILIHKSTVLLKCKACDKGFTQLSRLKKHYLLHEGKKPHKCKTCSMSFTYLAYLKRHNLIHEAKKPYQCKTCGNSFTQLSHLNRHNLIHEGKKLYQCKTCGKNFTQLSHLNRHSLIHEGKKPHKCKICNKSFTHLSNLKRHNLIHEGKKPHKCKICDKSFTHLSSLNTHSLLHEDKKPHKCRICDKSFTQFSYLKTHDLIHEGRKPHQCKACDKRFTQLSNLKRHYSIHESKK